MSSLFAKDRVSACLFTFADGRRCRTPRSGTHPQFCFYHARKESKARAAEKLGHELSYFFSGDFVTACDLSTALARLLPAVAHGDIKPKTATTLAYLAQTFLQTLHLSQHEFITAVGEKEWRKTVCDSINQNFDYLESPPNDPTESPAQPQAQPPSPPPASQPRPTPAPATSNAQPPAPCTATSSSDASSPAHQSAAIMNVPNSETTHPQRSEEPGANADASPIDVTRPSSAFAPHTEPAVNPTVPAPKLAPPFPLPAADDPALSVERPVFRRRRHSTSTNPFKTNIYTPPRNY